MMIPPKDEFNRILFWWLIVLPLIIFIGGIMITDQVTWGDILAFAIPILIATLVFIGRQLYYRRNFFTLKGRKESWYTEYPNEGIPTPLDPLTIPLGQSTHILMLTTKADVTVRKVHFHFNDRKAPKGLTDKNKIVITNLERPPDVYPSWSGFEARINKIGGCDGEFQDPPNLAKNVRLYLQMTIEAHQPLWKGYLVFYSARGIVSGSGYAYLAIEVMDK